MLVHGCEQKGRFFILFCLCSAFFMNARFDFSYVF